MDYNILIQQVKNYVEDYIQQNKISKFCFHNDIHTFEVVEAASEMSQYYQLNEKDNFIIICAAYFHDLGYLNGGGADHEARGAALAASYLEDQGLPKEIQEQVIKCIKATKMPQSPKTLLEQILCDADLFHLGGEQFDARNKLMRKEMESVTGHSIDKDIWRNQTIELMRAHHYHTEYAKHKLNAIKSINLETLTKKSKKTPLHTKETTAVGKDDRAKKPERGIETMFRITSSNNQRLSDMADNKANILLTVNSIILSMVIAVLLRKLDSNEHLVIPTVLLLTISVSTMVIAILSTIPKVPPGVFTPDEIRNKSVNLLFFGNFYKMKLEEYKDGMEKVMDDSEFLYGMLTKDVYSQGVVLGRKYKLLRLAYGIFMFGLIISSVAFLITVSI
jgi:predicted metal-dependent HD superfamily phosphohydrolase